MSVITTRTPDDCFEAAVRRFERDPDAWKGFNGTMEFVLTTDGEPMVSHLKIDVGEMQHTPGPSPATPIGRVTMSASDFVLFANGVLDENLAHRRGQIHLEGDMYVLHKLPTLLVTDVPLYQFRTGDEA